MLRTRTAITREIVLTTTASMPPEPELDSTTMSLDGPEERAHPVEHPNEHGRELRAAMIDHLAAARGPNGGRQPDRAGDPEVGLEAGHGRASGVGETDRDASRARRTPGRRRHVRIYEVI